MLRNKPRLTYNGLTVIVSNPSRFDTKGQLITAGGGKIFDEALRPNFNRYQCDIRVKEDKSPFLDGTKCLMLLGESAAKEWLRNNENPIGAIRGSPYLIDNIPAIPSFLPQDAADIKDFEKKHNPLDDEFGSEDEKEDKEVSSISEKRRHGKTARRNFQFWLKHDIQKAKEIILKYNGRIPPPLYDPTYILRPSANQIIRTLTGTKGRYLYLDIESWYPDIWIKCFSFSFGINEPIFCVPVYNWDNTWAYDDLHCIIRALSIAIRDNITVAHNGSGFDFFVLGWKYHIPIGKYVYDTMIAQHRIFSDVEKSLGHCQSYWTYIPFHKDEGDTGYRTSDQVTQTLQYCGKDVYSIVLLHHYQTEYAKRVPGMIESIQEGNAAIRPYLICKLQGFLYNEEEVKRTMNENDRLMMQYLRMCRILVGDDNLKAIGGKSKSSLLASPAQQVKYFHDLLGYPVVGQGNVRQDGTKGPSLGAENMFKLRLKVENPVVDLILAYREVAKESGALKFKPWNINESCVAQDVNSQ